MICREELARARETIFGSETERLMLANHEARHAIQVLEVVDRMVDADLIIQAEDDHDVKEVNEAQLAFDRALDQLIAIARDGRDALTQTEEAKQQ